MREQHRKANEQRKHGSDRCAEPPRFGSIEGRIDAGAIHLDASTE
jgi:hypothetical protein